MSCSVCAGYVGVDCPCCGSHANIITCPDCGGTGEGDYKVWDIHERIEVGCDRLTYLYSANTEDDAEERGQRYCKLSCVCQTCQGEGTL